MSNTTKIAVAVVVLVLAVVLYVVRSDEGGPVTSRTDYNATLECMACNHQFKANLQVTDRPPHLCPNCDKKEAWQLRQCRDCGEVFLPPLEGDPPRQPMIATCPKCKSQATGAVRMDD